MKLTEQFVSIGRTAKTAKKGLIIFSPFGLQFHTHFIVENFNDFFIQQFIVSLMPIHFEEVANDGSGGTE
jgi:hypothetical protein